MADSKITALTALTSADPINDVCPIVDVSDTTMAASGTTKKISINNLLSSSPTASGNFTITGDLTVDTNVLKVDTTNNRVGIGTASPGYAADVSVATTDGLRVKNTLATGAYFNRFHISNDTGINFIGYGPSYGGGTVLGLGVGSNSIFSDAAAPFGIATSTSQPLVLGTNGSEKARLDSSGNLGLSVAPSAWTATYRKALQINTYCALSGDSFYGMTDLANNAYESSTGTWKYVTTQAASRYNQDNNGKHVWYTAPSGTAGNAITFTQAMTLDASGRLMINTTSTDSFLKVVQTSSYDALSLDSANGSTYTTLNIRSNGTTKSQLFNDIADSSLIVRTTSAAPIRIGTNSTERMTVKTNGQVRFVPLAADPAGAEAGDVYYNSVSNRLKYYNGTAWTLI